MQRSIVSVSLVGMVGFAGAFASLIGPVVAGAQEHVHAADEVQSDTTAASDHSADAMWMTPVGSWHLMAMAHIYPSVTAGAPFSSGSPLHRTRIAFPHAGVMANLESPGSRWVFRLMPNLEGLTLPDGEVTFGGWGEGFIDARHPHTLLHEAMLSFNWWDGPGGRLSLSAGRGFAPYGTEDPMYRPALKYPTNHHLSQILERWTANVSYLSRTGLGVELGVFDGNEPEDSWDVGNIDNFGNSWSGRLSYRWGAGDGGTRPWEISGSYGRVQESHGAHEELTVLYNAALRHEAHHDFGHLFGLLEASRSEPEEGEGYFSVLGELQAGMGALQRHRPYARIEYATRPEYPRDASEGSGFFRYDHDRHALGATRWLISTVGYGFDLTRLPLSARPFVEAQHVRIQPERGPAGASPEALFGGTGFWSFSAGVRMFFGGGPMRMGGYGVLDPMSEGMRGSGDHDGMDHHEGMHDGMNHAGGALHEGHR